MTPQTLQPMAGDYDAIQAAVMETARGRWFLQEYARRNRHADTTLLLGAITRIESALRIQTAIPAPSHPPGTSHAAGQSGLTASSTHQLHELRDAIVLTKESLPAVGADGRVAFRNADFSRIAAGIELVAARVRSTADHAQETAWSLRERAKKEFGLEKDALDRRAGELEAHARELSGFCTQLEELTASATMVADLLAEIEARLDGIIAQQKDAPSGLAPINTPPPAPQAATAAQSQANPEPAQDVVTDHPAPEPVVTALVASQPVTEPAAIQPVAEPVVSQAVTEPKPIVSQDASRLERLAPPVRDRHAPPPASSLDFEFHDEPPPAITLPNPALRESDLPVTDPAPPQADIAQAAPMIEPQAAETKVAETKIVETKVADTKAVEAKAVEAKAAEAKVAEAPVEAPIVSPAVEVSPIVETAREIEITPEPAEDFPASFAIGDTLSDYAAAFQFDPLSHGMEPEPPSPPESAVNDAPRTSDMADMTDMNDAPRVSAVNAQAPAVQAAVEPAPKPVFRSIQLLKVADPLASIMALSDEEKIALFS